MPKHQHGIAGPSVEVYGLIRLIPPFNIDAFCLLAEDGVG